MRQTSVMLSVDDALYNEVVEPMKRNKSFAKLVVALLKGYCTDTYIRSFIDDTLDEVHRAVVGSFESSVDDMESVLADMGLLTDELHGQAQGGYQKFKKHGEEQKPDAQSNVHKNDTEDGEDIEALREKVSDLEKTVSEGFEQLFEQLKNLSSVGSVAVAGSEPEVDSGVKAVSTGSNVHMAVEDLIHNNIQSITAPESKPNIPVHTEYTPEGTSEVDDSVDSSMANSFLTSLVADFGSY